jgi:hypothetical protein
MHQTITHHGRTYRRVDVGELEALPRRLLWLDRLMKENGVHAEHGRRREIEMQDFGTSAMQARDFLQAGGWRIEHAGRTGNPLGRQRQSTPRLLQGIVEAVTGLDGPEALLAMHRAIKAGRHRTCEQQSLYDDLRAALAGKRISATGMAESLTVTERTAYRLKLESGNSPKGEETTQTNNQEADAPMRPASHGNAEEASLYDPEIPNDEQLADDARTLLDIASRWQTRFPLDADVAEAVDTFLDTARGHTQDQ